MAALRRTIRTLLMQRQCLWKKVSGRSCAPVLTALFERPGAGWVLGRTALSTRRSNSGADVSPFIEVVAVV